MRAPRRWGAVSHAKDAAAIAARLPVELKVTTGFDDAEALVAWQAGVARWLDGQFPDRSDELAGQVMKACGITVAHWYAAQLGTSLRPWSAERVAAV